MICSLETLWSADGKRQHKAEEARKERCNNLRAGGDVPPQCPRADGLRPQLFEALLGSEPRSSRFLRVQKDGEKTISLAYHGCMSHGDSQ